MNWQFAAEVPSDTAGSAAPHVGWSYPCAVTWAASPPRDPASSQARLLARTAAHRSFCTPHAVKS
jgi:hypothetical protein